MTYWPIIMPWDLIAVADPLISVTLNQISIAHTLVVGSFQSIEASLQGVDISPHYIAISIQRVAISIDCITTASNIIAISFDSIWVWAFKHVSEGTISSRPLAPLPPLALDALKDSCQKDRSDEGLHILIMESSMCGI